MYQQAEPGLEPVITLKNLLGVLGSGGERCYVNVSHRLLVHCIQAEKHSLPETLQQGVWSNLVKHIALQVWMFVEHNHIILVTINHLTHFISLFYLIFSQVFSII